MWLKPLEKARPPGEVAGMQLVTVSSAFNPIDAQVVCAQLEAAGFNAVISQELSALSVGGYGLSVGGILVQVPEDQAAEARELLAAEPPPPSS